MGFCTLAQTTYHLSFDGAIVTAEMQMYAFPFRLMVFVGGGVLAICAEQPDLPVDRAVVRIENEMRRIFVHWHWYGGGRRSRYAQIEENFPLYGVVFLLDVDIVRRGKFWWEVWKRWRDRGRALLRRAIWGRALRNVWR